jgi:hypothetical protein
VAARVDVSCTMLPNTCSMEVAWPLHPNRPLPERRQDSERVLPAQATELPPVTRRRPVKLCGKCQPELRQEILATLRLVE